MKPRYIVEVKEWRGIWKPQTRRQNQVAPNRATNWQRQTIAETFERIRSDPAHPWLAIGDFLDDWRFTPNSRRFELVNTGIAASGATLDLQRWGAFCAAMVEWLCWQAELPFPPWTNRDEYRLAEPWFLYPGDLLRAWQLVTTPAPFKLRNIFGGDQMLDRA